MTEQNQEGEEEEEYGAIIIGDRISAESYIPTPHKELCRKCGATIKLTQASYEAWRSTEGPHYAECVDCFHQEEDRSKFDIQPITIDQVREIVEAIRHEKQGGIST